MSIVKESGRRVGCYIVSESANVYRSRDQVMFLTGAVYVPGQVLGQVTASKKFAPLDTAASDGTQTAAAICYGHYDASDEDARGVITSRDSEINLAELVWPSGISDANKTAALAALNGKGIVGR